MYLGNEAAMLVVGRYVVGDAVVEGVNLPPEMSGAVAGGMPVRSEAWDTPGVVTNI
jgi:hypothetical protein